MQNKMMTTYINDSVHSFTQIRKSSNAIGYIVHKCIYCNIIAKQYGFSQRLLFSHHYTFMQVENCISDDTQLCDSKDLKATYLFAAKTTK
jgi:hypothetical protein